MQATDYTGAGHDRRAGVVIVTTPDRGACPSISNVPDIKFITSIDRAYL